MFFMMESTLLATFTLITRTWKRYLVLIPRYSLLGMPDWRSNLFNALPNFTLSPFVVTNIFSQVSKQTCPVFAGPVTFYFRGGINHRGSLVKVPIRMLYFYVFTIFSFSSHFPPFSSSPGLLISLSSSSIISHL